MGTSHDQCVDPVMQKGCHISSCDLVCHRILPQSLFHKGDKKRTGLGEDLGIGHDLMDKLRVRVTGNRRTCADDTDPAVFGAFTCSAGSGTDHTDDRNRAFPLDLRKGICTCRIAGNRNGLDFAFQKETDDLPAIARHGLPRFASVGNTCRISKIDDLFVGDLAHDLPRDSETADAGIKDTDRHFRIQFAVLSHNHMYQSLLYIIFRIWICEAARG